MGYGLDENAIKEVSKNWRFEPATYNGEPVDVTATIDLTFSLGGSQRTQQNPRPGPSGSAYLEDKASDATLDSLLESGVKASPQDLLGKWYCVSPHPFDSSVNCSYEVEYFPDGRVEGIVDGNVTVYEYSFVSGGKILREHQEKSIPSVLETVVRSGDELVFIRAGGYSVCSRWKREL